MRGILFLRMQMQGEKRNKVDTLLRFFNKAGVLLSKICRVMKCEQSPATHQSNNASTNARASNGRKSSIFSPTPI